MGLENLVTLSPYAQNMVENVFPILLDYRTVPLLASTVVKFKASPQRWTKFNKHTEIYIYYRVVWAWEGFKGGGGVGWVLVLCVPNLARCETKPAKYSQTDTRSE